MKRIIDNIAIALMSGGVKARELLKNGTEEEKKAALDYLEAEKKMFEFYNFVEKEINPSP